MRTSSSSQNPALTSSALGPIRIDVAPPVPEIGAQVGALTIADFLQLLNRVGADVTVFVSGDDDICGCIHVRRGEVVDADAGLGDAFANFFLLCGVERGYVATAEQTACDDAIRMPLDRLLLLALER